MTSATVVVTPGAVPGTPPALLPAKLLDQRVGVRAVADSGFAKLIVHDRLGGCGS